MSKDPAFLFYPGDWLGGTITFTRAQKGAYMDLLMAQFNQVALTSEDIRQVLGEDDFRSMWESKLRAKFETESNGRLFFNRKLRVEVLRRKGFCESRRNNIEGKNQYSLGHMTNHKSAHMEIENEANIKVVNKNNSFKPPTIEEVTAYCSERKNGINASKFIAHYEASGWMRGKTKIKDWKACVRTWESNNTSGPKVMEGF